MTPPPTAARRGSAARYAALCGSAQFFDVENAPDATYIAAATLDGGVHPGRPPDSERHGYVDSMPAWERINGITVHRR